VRPCGFGLTASRMTAGADPTRAKANGARRRRRSFKVRSIFQEAEMEAVKSPTSFEAIEYVLVAAPAALFLSLYLLGGL
jgi:hypothetical protein